MGRKKGGKNKPKEKELAGTITFTDKENINFEELNKKVAEQNLKESQ